MYRIIVLNVEDMKKKFANIAERKEMITSFEHNYNIGDTVYLIFLSKGKYRVRKKSGKNIDEYNGFPGCWSIKKELVANNVSKPNSQHFCNIFERLYK